MKIKSILIVVALLAGSVPASAQVMLQKAVIAAGGGISSGLILKSNITIGQAFVGTASNATTKGQIGFWTPANPQPLQDVQGSAPTLDLAIQTWPNPVSKECKVTVTSSASEIDIRLFDLNGKEVKAIYSGPATIAPVSFNVSSLPAGSYIIAARSPGQLVEKLVSVVR
jgi:hypothetical protein